MAVDCGETADPIAGVLSAAARGALTTDLPWRLRGDPVDAQSRKRHSAQAPSATPAA